MGGRRLVIVAERDHSFIDLDTRDVLSIGRSPDNDIVVKDDMVSRRHAQIEKSADGIIRVRDLKSFNGTYLNERRVRDEELSLWDALRVGRTKLFLVERAETPAQDAPVGPNQTVVAEEEEGAEPQAEAEEAVSPEDMGATKTLEVADALASKEMRAIIEEVVRREREELEHQISRRIRDESGPSLLGSLSGYKVRVRRTGPADGGGDFYDVFRDNDLKDELHLALGSVSGVGVAACVAATVARHTLRGTSANRDDPPVDLLGPLREILGQTLHPGSALSLLLARLSPTGKVHIGALGGTGVLHYNSATDTVEVLRPPGRRDEEAARAQGMELTIKPDDRLLLASDGAGAIRKAEGEAYGPSRLQEQFSEIAKEPSPKEIVKRLVANYSEFTGNRPERDVTLMILAPQAT